jgi:hypothetical protein
LTNSGLISGTNNGIYLTNASAITGTLTNSGKISGGTSGLVVQNTSTITGSISNSGTISGVNGGVFIRGGSTVTGTISNSGTISGNTGLGVYNTGSTVASIGNSGTISGVNFGVIIVAGSTVTGTISNSNSGKISGNTGLAIFNAGSNVASLDNSGILSGVNAGIFIFEGSSIGGITNSGTISASGGATHQEAILLSSGTLAGGLTNSGLISGGTYGLNLKAHSTITGTVTNSGTISGGNSGIAVAVGSTISGGLTNSGTISGGVYSIYAPGVLDSIHITGNNTAKFIGAVSAPNTPVTVNSGATYTMDNGQQFTVSSFTNEGTLKVGEGSTGTITGDYLQTPGGEFRIAASSTTAGTYGQLTVTGTAALPAAAKIYVEVNNTNLFGTGGGTLAGVITAGTLFATTFAVTDSSVLIDFVGVKNGNSVDLTAIAQAANAGGATTIGSNTTGQHVLGTGESVSVAGAVTLSNNSDAIVALNATVAGSIINSGTINSTSNNAIGISSNASVTQIINNSNALISANLTGIAVGALGTITGGISNSGTIHGNEAGINVGSASIVTDNLSNSGTISGLTGIKVGFNSAIGSLTNSGTISGSGSGMGMGISLLGGSTIGSLINSGLISGNTGLALGNASSVASIDNSGTISGVNNGIYLNNGTITGTLTNSGTITGGSVTTNEAAINLQNATLGSLTNSGQLGNSTDYSGLALSHSTISSGIVNELGGVVSGKTAGIRVMNHSVINGGLANSGTITAIGLGINITSSSVISGGITNSSTGVIEGATGISISTGTLNGGINNAGSIRSNAPPARGTGIVILGMSDVNGGITNSGTISGGKYAIFSASASTLGDIINQSGGLISGALVLGSQTNVTNAGTISLPEATASTITGDYVQTSTGVFQIAASSTTTGKYGKLNVTGTATLPTAAKIDVLVNTTNLFGTGGGTLAGVISAGTLVSDGTFTVTDNSVLVDFTGAKNGNAVDLTVVAEGAGAGGSGGSSGSGGTGGNGGSGGSGSTGGSGGSGGTSAPSTAFEGSVKAVGASPSAGAANVFDRLLTTSLANGSTGNAGMDAVLNTLIASNSATQQQVANAVSQTLPLHTGGESAAITGSLHSVNHIVQSRQEGQQGRSSGEAFYEDGSAWAKPFGSDANQGDYNNVSGFRAFTGGIVFGADAEIKKSNRLGVAVAAANTDVSGKSSIAPQSSNVVTYQLAVYGSHSLNEVTDINFQVDVGKHINTGNRRIVFMGTTAQSNYHSLSEHVGVGAAHTLTLSEVTTFTPSVRADYTTVLNNAYTESGAGALNLNVDKSVVNEMLITADGKFTRKVQENTTLTANLGVSYDALAKQNSITSAFAGDATASFTTLGLNASPWLARGGLGFVRTQNGTEVTLRYDVDARTSHLVNQTVSAKVRWSF